MRTKLAAEAGNRKKFQGTFSRLGKKINYTGYSEDTILLVQITDMATGLVVADHVWFSYTKGFEQVRLSEGVRVEFEARVKEYKKGYVNPALGRKRKTTDFKLSHPTRIRRAVGEAWKRGITRASLKPVSFWPRQPFSLSISW